MKKVFIPKGEIVTHNCLFTDRVIVKGVLQISGKLVAREIVGGGVIEAREIVCDDIRADHVTADFITARRIAVNKLFVQFECRASEAVAVRDYVTAGYMNTGKLSLTLSDIQSCDADEVITLKRKSGMLGLLWASWWRSLFLGLFYGGEMKKPRDKKKPVEATKAEASAHAPIGEIPAVPAALAAPDDATIDKLIEILTSLLKHGYRFSKSEVAPTGEEKAA